MNMYFPKSYKREVSNHIRKILRRYRRRTRRNLRADRAAINRLWQIMMEAQ